MVGTGRFELPTPRTPSGHAIFSMVSHQLPRCAPESVFMHLSAHSFSWEHYRGLLLKIAEGPHNFPHSFPAHFLHQTSARIPYSAPLDCEG